MKLASGLKFDREGRVDMLYFMSQRSVPTDDYVSK